MLDERWPKKDSNDSQEQDLYTWCIEQACARELGDLDQEKIDKLNSIGFPWDQYTIELYQMGFAKYRTLEKRKSADRKY